MKEEKDIDQLYQNELLKIIEELDAERISARNRVLIFFGLMVITLVLGFLTVFVQLSGVTITLLVIAAALTIIAYMLYSPANDRYKYNFKEKIIKRIIGYVNPEFNYFPKDWIGEEEYTNSGLFLQSPDRCKGDDLVEGIYQKTTFRFSELHSEREEGSGKSSRWVTIFKGLFFIADFNKHFTSRTYVWSEHNPQLSILETLFSSFAKGLEKVKLESTEFEDRFVVYSNDQVEARYILSTAMMERMVQLQDQMNANVVFSFVDTKIYAAIPIDEDLFEPSLYVPTGLHSIQQYYKTVCGVLNMIDVLKLNLRIWNKD